MESSLVPTKRCNTKDCENPILYECQYHVEQGLVMGPKTLTSFDVGGWCEECARRLANHRRLNAVAGGDSKL